MSVISVRPTTPATSSIFQSTKLQKSGKRSKIFAKRLDVFGPFDYRESIYCYIRRRSQTTMTGSNWVRASTSEEGVQAFEQEAFKEGSSYVGAGGLEAILNCLSKWFVAALFGAILLLRHDSESLWATMGAVINAILSTTLKKILNQERPISTLRSDPGMPSSHAQSIFYTITFLNLSIVDLYGLNGLTTTLGGLFLVVGSYFSWLRVSQQFHTISQVIVGAVLGSIFSILWFWSWNYFVLNLFISSLWIRIVIVLGAVGFCVGFISYVIQSWIMKEDDSVG